MPPPTIFEALADANVNVDTIVQNEPRTDGVDAEVSFTLRAARICGSPRRRSRRSSRSSASRELETDPEVGKVSIIGAGMRSHPGVAAKVFRVLADEEINIEMINTSPIKITCLIRAEAGDPGGPRAAHRVRARRPTTSSEEGRGQEAR